MKQFFRRQLSCSRCASLLLLIAFYSQLSHLLFVLLEKETHLTYYYTHKYNVKEGSVTKQYTHTHKNIYQRTYKQNILTRTQQKSEICHWSECHLPDVKPVACDLPSIRSIVHSHAKWTNIPRIHSHSSFFFSRPIKKDIFLLLSSK